MILKYQKVSEYATKTYVTGYTVSSIKGASRNMTTISD